MGRGSLQKFLNSGVSIKKFRPIKMYRTIGGGQLAAVGMCYTLGMDYRDSYEDKKITKKKKLRSVNTHFQFIGCTLSKAEVIRM